jgi:hypothetical protein
VTDPVHEIIWRDEPAPPAGLLRHSHPDRRISVRRASDAREFSASNGWPKYARLGKILGAERELGPTSLSGRVATHEPGWGVRHGIHSRSKACLLSKPGSSHRTGPATGPAARQAAHPALWPRTGWGMITCQPPSGCLDGRECNSWRRHREFIRAAPHRTEWTSRKYPPPSSRFANSGERATWAAVSLPLWGWQRLRPPCRQRLGPILPASWPVSGWRIVAGPHAVVSR